MRTVQPPADSGARPTSDQASVSVRFQLTPEDWTEACAVHYLGTEETRKAVRQVRILFLLSGGLGVLLGLLGGPLSTVVLWALFGFGGATVFPRLLRRTQRRQLRKMSRAGILNGMFGLHRVELREDGILNSTSGYEMLVRWPSVEKVEETEGMFMVYTGPHSFLIIPTSAFVDLETTRAFADAFYRRVSGARQADGRGEVEARGAEGSRGPERVRQVG